MKYLLDTNTCIRFINGRAQQIREKMLTIANSDIGISTIVQAEMFAGSAKSQTQNDHVRFNKSSFDASQRYLTLAFSWFPQQAGGLVVVLGIMLK